MAELRPSTDATPTSADPGAAGRAHFDPSDWAEAKARYGLRPFFEENAMGVVVDVGDKGIQVKTSEARRGWFEPQGFGDWEFELGDEIAVGTDVHGQWHATPAVHRIVAPAVRVEAGDLVDLGDVTARIPSPAKAEEVSALAKTYAGTALNYLVVLNTRTDEFRVWGAFSDLDPARNQVIDPGP